jgi:hypothetical protein
LDSIFASRFGDSQFSARDIAEIKKPHISHNTYPNNMLFAMGASVVAVATALSSITLMVTTPNKASKPSPAKKIGNGVAPMKPSPKRKEFTQIRLSDTDMKQKRKLAYYLKIVKLLPEFELAWIESGPGTDGYAQKLFDHIANDHGYRDEGVLMVVRRRVSVTDNAVLTNARDTYPRRAII